MTRCSSPKNISAGLIGLQRDAVGAAAEQRQHAEDHAAPRTSEMRQTPRILAVSSMWKNANIAISAMVNAEMS